METGSECHRGREGAGEGPAPIPSPEKLLLASRWLAGPDTAWAFYFLCSFLSDPRLSGKKQLTQPALLLSKGMGGFVPFVHTGGWLASPHRDVTTGQVPSMILGWQGVNPSCMALGTGLRNPNPLPLFAQKTRALRAPGNSRLSSSHFEIWVFFFFFLEKSPSRPPPGKALDFVAL